jgi:hypothetical protein
LLQNELSHRTLELIDSVENHPKLRRNSLNTSALTSHFPSEELMTDKSTAEKKSRFLKETALFSYPPPMRLKT